MVRDPQKELDELNKRKAELEESLSKREAELKELRSKKKSLLERQIRRAQVRINAKERKRRTRRLILMGSYLEHRTGDDPGKRDSLRKDLDGFLERDPRTGPCSTCLPVPIRAPKPCRWGSVSFLAVFPGRVPGSLNRMFSFWGWFCSWKVYPQTRRAYYLFSYYLLFNYMYGGVFQRKN